MRVPALAVCGTTPHCTKLELLLTEFLYAELGREGSTYYTPDFDSKAESETLEAKAAPKEKPKKKEKVPVKKTGKDNKDKGKDNGEEPSEEKTGTKRNGDSKDQPKPSKKTKKEEAEADDVDSDGSMPW